MTYILPQTQVFQDFTSVPAAADTPLNAHISGGHAYLQRYTNSAEQPNGYLGYYDSVLDENYAWPNRPAGSVIDQLYTKVFVQNALLRYFSCTVGSGSLFTKVAGYNNRIRTANKVLKTTTGYARSADFLSRDVAVGDIVKLRGALSGGGTTTLWTYVKSIIADASSASVSAASTDTNNPNTSVAGATITKIAGPRNCVTGTASASAYTGYASGYVTETYDVVVINSSVGGDHTTATLRVISGSGKDDVASVTPAAAASPTTIGTRGLTVTFSKSVGHCSLSAVTDAVAKDDLIAGQRWTVAVTAAFTKPVPTSGGTYTSTNNTTYVVKVTRGGLYAGATKPQISVTTVNGVDVSGPTNVTAAATPVAVGSYGATISFTGTGLRLGDVYYIPVTGIGQGASKTIELGDNIDILMTSGTEVAVDLHILKPDLEITQNRLGYAPLVNWATSDTQLTVKSGIVAYDSNWLSGGIAQALPVISESTKGYGKLYVHYRAWRSDLAQAVDFISDPGNLDTAISGPLHPDNPLKWGVYKALTNANGTAVGFTAIANPDDLTTWVDCLEVLIGRKDVYGLVPLTNNRSVLDLYVAHVNSQSSPTTKCFRVLWTSLQGIPTIPIVSAGSTVPGHTTATTSDGTTCLAVIEDDPNTSGTQYTIIRVPAGNSKFVTNGVRAGDIVRCLYVGDGFGNYTYTEFIVDAVQSESQLRVLVGAASPVATASKIEVWRNLKPADEAAEIATYAASFGSRRVRALWPDLIEDNGTVMSGSYLAAAYAGLTAGILPQQGITRLAISGFTSVSRTTDKFTPTQLDIMAASGVFIVTQNKAGTIYARHAVTTGNYNDVYQREEMVTRNVDSMSFKVVDSVEPFIGIRNATDGMLLRVSGEITSVLESLMQSNGDIGPQALAGSKLLSCTKHPTQADQFLVYVDIVEPVSLNVIGIHLVI